ncbi:MAG: hypothetical protein JO352_13750 [Chloroflexi bacterium]|nr:hypothetical protein [Chloroflexota bacterium]
MQHQPRLAMIDELSQIGDYPLQVDATATSPSTSANGFTEPNHLSRVQASRGSQPKDAGTQPLEFHAGGRGTATERL